jgi:hypothetical protein
MKKTRFLKCCLFMKSFRLKINRLRFVTGAKLLICSAIFSVILAHTVQAQTSLLTNGNFTNAGNSWITKITAPATGSITFANGSALFGINSASTLNWHVQLYQNVSITAGQVYNYSFTAKKSSAGTRNISFIVESDVTPFAKDVDRQIAIDGTLKSYSGSFTASSSRVVRIEIQAGLSDLDFEVDNFVVSSQTTTDVTPPVISTFTATPELATTYSRDLTISASDNVGITGYLTMTWDDSYNWYYVPPTPTLDDNRWTTIKPTSVYTDFYVGIAGVILFVKDAAGNISSSTTRFIMGDSYESDDTPQTAKNVIVNGETQYRNSHCITTDGGGNPDWAKFNVEIGKSYSIRVVHRWAGIDVPDATLATISVFKSNDFTTPVVSNSEADKEISSPTIVSFVAEYTGTYYFLYKGRTHYRKFPKETYTLEVINDTQAPNITFDMPTESSSQNIDVEISAWDNVDITGYHIYTENYNYYEPTPEDPNPNEIHKWTPFKPSSIYTPYTSGLVRVFIYAKDAAGNISKAEKTIRMVDIYESDNTVAEAKPIIVNATPQQRSNSEVGSRLDWATFTGEQGKVYTVNVAHSDNLSNYEPSKVSLYNSSDLTTPISTVVEQNGIKLSQITFTASYSGTYFICYTGRSHYRVLPQELYTLEVTTPTSPDLTPPSIQGFSVSLDDYSNQTRSISVAATDNNEVTGYCVIASDGCSMCWGSLPTEAPDFDDPRWTQEIPTSVTTDITVGAVKVSLFVRDAAGNVSSSLTSFYMGDAFENDDEPYLAKEIFVNAAPQNRNSHDADMHEANPDWAMFSAEQGKVYTITANHTNPYEYPWTASISLYTESDYFGSPIATASEAVENILSPTSITFTAAYSGTYYIRYSGRLHYRVAPLEKYTLMVTTPSNPDNMSPVISSFAVNESTIADHTRQISMIASDNNGITGYLIMTWDGCSMCSQPPANPSLNDSRWSSVKPSTLTTDINFGRINTILFVKDAAGNISSKTSAFYIGDIYESDDYVYDAKEVVINAAPQNRNSHDADYYSANPDWAKFTVEQGKVYTVTVKHAEPLGYPWLASISLYTENDFSNPIETKVEADQATVSPTSITFTAAYSGEYYVLYSGRRHYRIAPLETYTLEVTTAVSNLLINGNFANGGSPWISKFTAPSNGSVTYTSGTANFGINSVSSENWHAQFYQLVNVTAGKSYNYSFTAKKASAGSRNITFMVESDATPYAKDVNRQITIDGNKQTFSGTFTASASRIVRIEIQAGLSDLDFEVDDFVLTLVSSNLKSASETAIASEIKMNTIVSAIVYPTVTSSSLNVVLGKFIGNKKIEFFNIKGQLVYETTTNQSINTFDVRKFNTTGLILIKVTGNNSSETLKAIVK